MKEFKVYFLIYLLFFFELIDLKNNYEYLNLSTTEINLQIQRLFLFQYVSLMTILSAIIMFNTKKFQNLTLKISIGLLFSVIVYYINNFFIIMGKTEKMPILNLFGCLFLFFLSLIHFIL